MRGASCAHMVVWDPVPVGPARFGRPPKLGECVLVAQEAPRIRVCNHAKPLRLGQGRSARGGRLPQARALGQPTGPESEEITCVGLATPSFDEPPRAFLTCPSVRPGLHPADPLPPEYRRALPCKGKKLHQYAAGKS